MQICVVIVTFNPERDSFIALLERLYPQIQHLVIVDNSERCNNIVMKLCQETGLDINHLSLIRLGENQGIATALNIGIEEAIRLSAAFVLLSDQDSLPAVDMVANLLLAYESLTAKGLKVGAVGPTFTDKYTALTYPFQVQLEGNHFYGHKQATKEEPYVEALTLITSGALIPVGAFRNVGMMWEGLFVDQVDMEWCHRARRCGYRIFGTGSARMYQRMGEARLKVWYLHWRYESFYPPMRVYYKVRNGVAMWKLDYIDWKWKIRNSWYWLGIVYSHVVFGREGKARYFWYSCLGVWHGIVGKMGKFEGV